MGDFDHVNATENLRQAYETNIFYLNGMLVTFTGLCCKLTSNVYDCLKCRCKLAEFKYSVPNIYQ